jgi:hypothetical protein
VAAEQARPPFFMGSAAAHAVTTRDKVPVLGARHEAACLGQDQGRLFELGIETVLLFERDRHALHVVAVFAVNVDQPARHRVLRCPVRPRRIANCCRQSDSPTHCTRFVPRAVAPE